jgi:hypothetical protein
LFGYFKTKVYIFKPIKVNKNILGEVYLIAQAQKKPLTLAFFIGEERC